MLVVLGMASDSTEHLESPCWLSSAGAKGMKRALFRALFYPGTLGVSFSIRAVLLRRERGEEDSHK